MSFQGVAMYIVGVALFFVFEVAIGQSGNTYVDMDQNQTQWTLDVLLFFNSVTSMTIGFGANFYPRNEAGRGFLIICKFPYSTSDCHSIVKLTFFPFHCF